MFRKYFNSYPSMELLHKLHSERVSRWDLYPVQNGWVLVVPERLAEITQSRTAGY